MSSGTSCTEDTDGADKMAKKWVLARNYCMGGQAGSYHDLRQTYCLNCDKLPPDACHGKPLEMGKFRRKKTKNQPQHCPSCHCPPAAAAAAAAAARTGRLSTRRANICQDVDAILNGYEEMLEDPECQKFKRSPSALRSPWYPSGCSQSPTSVHQFRKRQTSRHRRQCKKECDEIISAMLANDLNGGVNDISDMCCMCYGEVACKDEQVGRVTGDHDIGERCVQHKRERISWQEPLPRHRPESVNKGIGACEKYESGDNEEDEDQVLRTMKTLKFYEPKREDARKRSSKTVSKTVTDAWQEQATGIPHNILHSLEARTLRTTPGKWNDQELKISKNDADDRSMDGILSKEAEDRSICGKPEKRFAARQDPIPDKEPTIIGDKSSRREDIACYESATSKNEEQGTHPCRKNIFAGGDLDLHVHKNDFIGLLLRVVGNVMDGTLVKQKNDESNEGTLAEQGISTELMRALQRELTQPLAEDSSNHRESRIDCIRQLKMRRWKHIKHIHSELTELCNLQMLLDNCSARQCLPSTVEAHSHAVEQQNDEEQQRQQQDE